MKGILTLVMETSLPTGDLSGTLGL